MCRLNRSAEPSTSDREPTSGDSAEFQVDQRRTRCCTDHRMRGGPAPRARYLTRPTLPCARSPAGKAPRTRSGREKAQRERERACENKAERRNAAPSSNPPHRPIPTPILPPAWGPPNPVPPGVAGRHAKSSGELRHVGSHGQDVGFRRHAAANSVSVGNAFPPHPCPDAGELMFVRPLDPHVGRLPEYPLRIGAATKLSKRCLRTPGPLTPRPELPKLLARAHLLLQDPLLVLKLEPHVLQRLHDALGPAPCSTEGRGGEQKCGDGCMP